MLTAWGKKPNQQQTTTTKKQNRWKLTLPSVFNIHLYSHSVSVSWFGYFPNDAQEENAGGWRGKRKDPIFQIVVI